MAVSLCKQRVQQAKSASLCSALLAWGQESLTSGASLPLTTQQSFSSSACQAGETTTEGTDLMPSRYTPFTGLSRTAMAGAATEEPSVCTRRSRICTPAAAIAANSLDCLSHKP